MEVPHSLIESSAGLFIKQSAIDFDGKYLNSEIIKSVVDKMSTFLKQEPK